MLSQVKFAVDEGLQNDKDQQKGCRGAYHDKQETACQNRNVHYNDAWIRLAHELVGPGGGKFTLVEIIVAERNTMTDKQGEEGQVSYLQVLPNRPVLSRWATSEQRPESTANFPRL